MNDNPTPDLVSIDREVFTNLCAEANINRRPLARHLLSVAQYLGVGALIHAWFLGPDFDRDSLWSWAYLMAWPVPLSIWLLTKLAIFFLYAGTISFVCALLWWATVEIVERRARAKSRKPGFRQPPRSWDARQ